MQHGITSRNERCWESPTMIAELEKKWADRFQDLHNFKITKYTNISRNVTANIHLLTNTVTQSLICNYRPFACVVPSSISKAGFPFKHSSTIMPEAGYFRCWCQSSLQSLWKGIWKYGVKLEAIDSYLNTDVASDYTSTVVRLK